MYETDTRNNYEPRRRRRRRGGGCGVALLLLVVFVVLAGILLFGEPNWLERLLPAVTSEPGTPTYTEPGRVPETDVPAGATGEPDVLAELQRRAAADPRYADILDHLDLYPEDLLLLAAKNEEAVDFVLGYPEHMQEEVDAWSIDLSGDYVPGNVPLLMQWDSRWGYAPYDTNLMGLAGCGPTCLSMVVIGLTGDLTANPLAVADYSASQGWYVEDQGTSWELMRSGAEHFGLYWRELPLDESTICQALDAGERIIASMTAGDFTDSGHFIVICGYDADGFRVLDPNSRQRSGQSWSFDTLSRQINNLWAYSA